MIPPRTNAEFVCAREDVLKVYTRPDDPQRLQVGKQPLIWKPYAAGGEHTLTAVFTCIEHRMGVGVPFAKGEGESDETLLNRFTDAGGPGL